MRTKYCSKSLHFRDADVDYWTILKLYVIMIYDICNFDVV
jgi:hypothetical protein